MGASSVEHDGSHPSSPNSGSQSHDDETVVRSDDASAPNDGGAAPPLPSDFGRYTIEKTLGQGGMGAVYLAHDSQLDRKVALKVPRFRKNEQPDVIERFFREARSMATLTHPNLCPVFDVGEHEGIHFLTMAYIEGEELSQRLKKPAASAFEPVDVIRKVALALEEAHRAGLVHRDLKPSNIMVDHRGEPIVMDFGLARRDRQGEAEITQTGAIVGTPAYMPPEQIEGEAHNVGPTADIYSLGVIFYQLLCGRLPFGGAVAAVLSSVLTKEPDPPSLHRPSVDPALEAVCLKAMAKVAADRYQSMGELVAALDEFTAAPERAKARQRRQEAAERPALVSSCRHDLFVAYLSLDDEAPPGVKGAGWVTTLVDNLDWRLRQLCGRSDALSVWMDETQAKNPQADTAFQERLRDTATVLLVVSPGFAASGWCHGGNGFLDAIGAAHLNDDRVFIVECDRVTAEQRPEALGRIRAIPFWTAHEDSTARRLGYPQPQPDADFDYYARIDDLARQVHARLSRMAGGRPTQPATVVAPMESSAASINAGGDAVFLAEVTDDLDPLRDEVQRYLSQAGYEVFPKVWYPREPNAFAAELNRDIQNCLAFVQLLGPFPGKKPPGATQSYPNVQHQAAGHAGLPVLQWRDASLDCGSIPDEAYRTLVEGPQVEAVDLEQFKRDVLKRVAAEKAARDASLTSGVPMQDQAFIFVNVERGDMPIADDLCELLDESGFSYALPMHEGRPDEIRQDLEANLLDCDGLIVVYGEITEQWVREQLRQWRKILFRRDKPLRALAVYEGPPPEKKRLGMKLPKMHVIDCRNGMELGKVRGFLESLGASSN